MVNDALYTAHTLSSWGIISGGTSGCGQNMLLVATFTLGPQWPAVGACPVSADAHSQSACQCESLQIGLCGRRRRRWMLCVRSCVLFEFADVQHINEPWKCFCWGKDTTDAMFIAFGCCILLKQSRSYCTCHHDQCKCRSMCIRNMLNNRRSVHGPCNNEQLAVAASISGTNKIVQCKCITY